MFHSNLSLFLLLFYLSNLTQPIMGQTDREESIRQKVEMLSAGNPIQLLGEPVYCTHLIQEFYQLRGFQSAWQSSNIDSLLSAIQQAEYHGLNAEDYHFSALTEFYKEAQSDEEWADLDFLATDAFLLYASHFLNGKVNPETVDSEWKAVRREGNARRQLENALANQSIYKTLLSLAPHHMGYLQMSSQLLFYRQIQAAGGWPQIPTGETLKAGMTDSVRIPLLSERLWITGDLKDSINYITYEPDLMDAVKHFQKRHGLETDGHLGKETLAALNIPVDQRVDQILLNMERHRWITQDLGDHYIMVNIADFMLQVYRDNELMMEKKVIVGKPFRKTPVFSSRMTYLVLNPYWTVPPTVLFNDILPEVIKNPGYLQTKNIKVLTGYGSEMSTVDPYSIDWTKLSPNYFPYVLRQDPGATNALGKVKFMFPNKYNVYIHDTPSKELFNRSDRAFSSGCIRVEKPIELTSYLLSSDPKWTDATIKTILESGEEQTIMLKNPVNVHIIYLTSWVQDGWIHFRKDLYNRDQPVIQALNSSSPGI